MGQSSNHHQSQMEDVPLPHLITRGCVPGLSWFSKDVCVYIYIHMYYIKCIVIIVDDAHWLSNRPRSTTRALPLPMGS